MIAVLPILLYPLVGMTFLQLKQFMQEHKTRVEVVGREEIAGIDGLPPLFNIQGNRFAESLVGESGLGDQVELVFRDQDSRMAGSQRGSQKSDPEQDMNLEQALANARQRLTTGEIAAIIYFPPRFGKELELFRQELANRIIAVRNPESANSDNSEPVSGDRKDVPPPVPQPEIIFSSANERSSLAHLRLSQILHQWTLAIGQQNLEVSRVPLFAMRPFEFRGQDLAQGAIRRAAVWAKILPFVVFVWALTGAFYPAVDLCAGEKERGTLETLLSSPASRAEIVWGKLLTVMIFSIATAVLNLVSLGATGQFVISQLQQMPGFGEDLALAPPPFLSLVWLLVALVPVSALFSALCLALAAVARSTREGQYYLLPVLLVTAPLMVLAISPGVELDLGKSLVPVSGLVLLLKSLIEGNYSQALPYVFPVLGVTAICCLLSIRWAVEQFSKESVLFRESERFDLRRWIIHAVRDRNDTPSIATALTCVALIFLLRFFMGFALAASPMETFSDIAVMFFVTQVVIILFPAVLLTLLFTRQRRRTLLLDRRPPLSAIGMGLLLACLMRPVGDQLVVWIQYLYPSGEEMAAFGQLIHDLLGQAPNFLWIIVLIAVLPACCEEIAFRGLILSGLRHLGHKWWAIGLSALFFGLCHSIMQQSIAAAVMGLVLGYLAVQTGSLIPCILFHMTYNSLEMVSGYLAKHSEEILEKRPELELFLTKSGSSIGLACTYQPFLVIACGVLALYVLVWFGRFSYVPSAEEYLEELRHQRTQESLV